MTREDRTANDRRKNDDDDDGRRDDDDHYFSTATTGNNKNNNNAAAATTALRRRRRRDEYETIPDNNGYNADDDRHDDNNQEEGRGVFVQTVGTPKDPDAEQRQQQQQQPPPAAAADLLDADLTTQSSSMSSSSSSMSSSSSSSSKLSSVALTKSSSASDSGINNSGSCSQLNVSKTTPPPPRPPPPTTTTTTPATGGQPRAHLAAAAAATTFSLLDAFEEDDEVNNRSSNNNRAPSSATSPFLFYPDGGGSVSALPCATAGGIAGGAGFLEMEPEPPRSSSSAPASAGNTRSSRNGPGRQTQAQQQQEGQSQRQRQQQQHHHARQQQQQLTGDNREQRHNHPLADSVPGRCPSSAAPLPPPPPPQSAAFDEDPIRTSSGLLLTHRRSSSSSTAPANSSAAAAARRGRSGAVHYDTPRYEARYEVPHTQTPRNLSNVYRDGDDEEDDDGTERHSNRVTSRAVGGGAARSSRAPPPPRQQQPPPPPRRQGMEVEQAAAWSVRGHGGGGVEPPRQASPWGGRWAGPAHRPFPLQARRWMSYVRAWVVVSGIVLLLGAAVVLRHAPHEGRNGGGGGGAGENDDGGGGGPAAAAVAADATDYYSDNGYSGISDLQYVRNVPAAERVILMPLESMPGNEHMAAGAAAAAAGAGSSSDYDPYRRDDSAAAESAFRAGGHDGGSGSAGGTRRALTEEQELRREFEDWIDRHGKAYGSEREKERRFAIWTENHRRTAEKNRRHGPCKLTGRPVFGSNHLKDLTAEEFQRTHLTGHGGYGEHKLKERMERDDVTVLGPHVVPPNHHPEIKRKLQAVWPNAEDDPVFRSSSSSSSSWAGSAGRRGAGYGDSSTTGASYSDCQWYDMSCILQYIFATYLYGLGGTMEPAYDSDSFPTAIDWRDYGAVTDVRGQGNCGACWAITAVETIESATFLSYGNLYTLSETEVIVCEGECEMCYGGWPQNAFDYVMEHKGLPLLDDLEYDGDYLLELSEAAVGDEDQKNSKDEREDVDGVCPDNDSSNGYARYGNIKGYGYATSKCVCYTDGTGCDCDSQNEGLALRNVATYGPAVVCLDASTWQDYEGGVMTSSSGCSSAFLDVNHCVQAVGYAFVDNNEEGGDYEDWSQQSGSGGGGSGGGGSGSHKSGSRDSGDREGYWIVRNQWTSYWGMNGYAYVSMGENTCGILNDMIQAYT